MPPLHPQVEERVLKAYISAQKVYGIEFPLPKITYRDNGRIAGTAHYFSNEIVLSPTLLERYGEDFIGRTVPHECAHLICQKVYPLAKQAHGPEFRSVCRALGMSDVSTYHTYDTSGLSKKRRPRKKNYRVYCGCDSHPVTGTIYRRMVLGREYRCRICSQKLRLTRHE